MRAKRKTYVRVLAFILLLCVLPVPARADDFHFEADFSTESIGDVFTRYFEESRMGEQNISMGWYDIESGESWYYGADTFKRGASTYKLPLAMVYIDMLGQGLIQNEERINGHTVDSAIKEILVNSNNSVAEAMKNRLSTSYKEVRKELSRYCQCEDTLPDVYYSRNVFSPRFMIGTLQTLYENGEKYAMAIDYLKQARPGDFFRLYLGETEVAQKYGSGDEDISCVGIVFADRPFLLAVYTTGLTAPKRTIGEIARIAADYADYLAAQEKIVEQAAAEEAEKIAEEAAAPLPEPAAESPSPTSLPEPKAEPVPAVSPVQEEKSSARRWVLPGAGITVILLCILIKKKKQSPDGE